MKSYDSYLCFVVAKFANANRGNPFLIRGLFRQSFGLSRNDEMGDCFGFFKTSQ